MSIPRMLIALSLALTVAGHPTRACAGEPGSSEHQAPWSALADPETPRHEVLAAFCAADEPNAAAIAMLERMVAEDRARPTPSQPLEELPPAERLAELIWRLRDQTAGGFGIANGSLPSMFARTGTPPTVCDQIVAFGHEAIPLLLDLVGDDRYTRIVVAPRPFNARRTHVRGVLRIGHAAKQVIERIADRPFIIERHARGVDRSAAVYRGWWSEVQAKGEFLATADEMDQIPDKYRTWASYLAARLLRMNPAAATPLVVRSCRREKDILARKALLDLVATATGEGVEPFLRSEVETGPTLLRRVTAAFALRDRTLSDPTPSMVDEWQRLSDHGQPWPSTREQWCLDGALVHESEFL